MNLYVLNRQNFDFVMSDLYAIRHCDLALYACILRASEMPSEARKSDKCHLNPIDVIY